MKYKAMSLVLSIITFLNDITYIIKNYAIKKQKYFFFKESPLTFLLLLLIQINTRRKLLKFS